MSKISFQYAVNIFEVIYEIIYLFLYKCLKSGLYLTLRVHVNLDTKFSLEINTWYVFRFHKINSWKSTFT